ncbi:hypothetical protein Vretimale_9260 [Volvox reticuliferus]|uniref:Biopterin transport-related protein BT1 n=1 Tax=Volvox reticuliferus TaxID=1737510 RepID=A0A8J4FR75_9CHLO|nr:hypothetical protein Vretifemale_10169 [Volvox reticuliferus]GIM04769.1 hypothetical protein Vretimale_9260 [Volvox reticuliferus]
MKSRSEYFAPGQQQRVLQLRPQHRRAMRTRMRAASPDPDLGSSHRSGPNSMGPGLPTSSKVHTRHHSNSLQPLQVAAHDRDAITDESSEWPKSTLLQRLSRLRHRVNFGRFADIRIMGLEPSPELVAISMVYFVQGILGLSRLAVSYFFKDELHIEPAEVAILTGLSSIPWMIKPLYGFISDSIPLFGYRRRSYLILCGLMGSVAWATLAYGVHDARGAVACMLLASLGTAASDVVVDSIVVERARGHHQSVSGSLQSLCWASAAIGGITSAYFSGSFVQEYGTRFVFGLTAFFPLAVSASSMLINERPVGAATPADREQSQRLLTAHAGASVELPGALASESGTDARPAVAGPSTVGTRLWLQSVALWNAVRRRDILMPAVFVFLWQATPSADSAMFYYQTNVLGFTPEFLGRVRLGGSIAALAGVAIFNTWLKTVPLRRLLWWVMVVGTVLSSSQLILISGLHRQWGLSDQLFVLGDSMVLTVLGQISFMPILVLAARMCPQGVEATLFATLMSVLNCGSMTGGALGAGLTKLYGVTSEDYTNLFKLVATCVALTMAPAPFLSLLPSELDIEKAAADGEQEGGAERSVGHQDAAIAIVHGPSGDTDEAGSKSA